MGRIKRLLAAVPWHNARPIDLAVALMVVLATMLLNASYQAPLAIWCALLLVASSIYLNDFTGWFRLDRRWANRISLASVVVWCIEARILQGDWQLVAITYVLLILQIILLFQAKTDRIAWQVIVLSIAQVAVAAGLSPGVWFAPLLVCYMLVGMAALAMLGMDQQLVLAGVGGAGRPTSGSAPIAAPGRKQLVFAADPVSWSRPLWRRALAFQIVGTTLVALALTLVLFLLFPRAERQPDEIDSLFDEEIRTVGYSHNVTLGDEVGQALLDPGDVMRIRFFEEPGHVPIHLAGDPLLRGSVATEYSQGRWSQPEMVASRGLKVPRPSESHRSYVRQQITIEPLDENSLFAIFPVFPVGSTTDDAGVQINNRGDQLLRIERYQWRRFEYELGTVAIQNRQQLPLVPRDDYDPDLAEELLKMPPVAADETDPLASLRGIADTVRTEAQLDPDQHYEIAQALTKYLRDSGKFEYSDVGQKRSAGIDPMEDFVTAHRRGHCEYFAGALALMLRSQGIPARMAIGFRASEWNSAGGYYHIRQLHAHAWVEALIDPAHLAKQSLPNVRGFDFSRGAWLTLDATPISTSNMADGVNRGLFGRIGMYVDYLQVLWGRFVAGLNYLTQQESIYQPLAALFARGWQQLQNLRKTLGLPPISQLGLLGKSWTWYRLHWFSFFGAVATVALLLAATGAVILLKRALGQLRRLAGRVAAPTGPRPSTNAIYGRLERVLARHGYRRVAGQTPYEFALAAGGELAERAGCSPLAPLPRRVVEAFYRVRFGRRPLDSSEVQAVEHALSALERGLGQASRRG